MVGEVESKGGSLDVSLPKSCSSLPREEGDIPLPSTLLPPCHTSSLGAGRPGGG
jgi:hypothetical protein